MIVEQPQSILIVRLSHLGDIVHSLPVFHAARRAWPEASFSWVVQREFSRLLEGIDGLDRLLLFDRDRGIGAWAQARRELKLVAPDLAIDAQGNWKSGLMTRISGAGRRIGLAKRHWQEPSAAGLMTDLAPEAPGIHAMHKMGALVRTIASDGELSFDLNLQPEELGPQGGQCLEHLAGAAGEGWILHLGRESDPRTWPRESYTELARQLSAKGCRVLILSGPGEQTQGQAVRDELQELANIAHWIGQADLRQLAAFFTEAALIGARFIGGDSGPTHLAAACNLAVSMLSGPQDPDLTGPWPLPNDSGSRHQVIRSTTGRLGPITDLTVSYVLDQLQTSGP